MKELKIHFSDFYNIEHSKIDDYGALDICLIKDNPVFVDPFLIFYSEKEEYQILHKKIIDYLQVLKNNSTQDHFVKNNYFFSEVKELWFGYAKKGNKGSGLGEKFAKELKKNLAEIFKYEAGEISKSNHFEKLCLISEGVGIDNISDFTLNIIKSFLIEYTQSFAASFIDDKNLSTFTVTKAEFDFKKEVWFPIQAKLPFIINEKGNKEFVLLCPKDILVKDETWISKDDFVDSNTIIMAKIENTDLRDNVNQFFRESIPKIINKKGKTVPSELKSDKKEAWIKTAKEFPEVLEYYIKYKEEEGEKNVLRNREEVSFVDNLFRETAKEIAAFLKKENFYELGKSFEESVKKVKQLKLHLEKRDGYKIFWDGDNLRNGVKETDIGILLDIVFNESLFSVDREVNNGRGPVDVKVSKGKEIQTLIEIKLASNPQIKNNLSKQLGIYKEANNTNSGIYVIVYFTIKDKKKLDRVLKDLKMDEYIDKNLFIIDCCKKVSASKAK